MRQKDLWEALPLPPIPQTLLQPPSPSPLTSFAASLSLCSTASLLLSPSPHALALPCPVHCSGTDCLPGESHLLRQLADGSQRTRLNTSPHAMGPGGGRGATPRF